MSTDNTPDWMSTIGVAPEQPKMGKPSGRKTKKSLLDGEIQNATLSPERVEQETVKMMKVIAIKRVPEGRIVNVEMRVKDGTLYDLEIDEATVRALSEIFD